jgi:hypothetical protein
MVGADKATFAALSAEITFFDWGGGLLTLLEFCDVDARGV